MHVTRDGGKNWEKVTPPDLPDFTRISLIEASPHQNGAAYLVGNRYQLGDRKPYIYKTTDFGKTLDEDRHGHSRHRLPAHDPRGSEAAGACSSSGTEHGIYVSFNDGAAWQPLKLNLPTTPVHGIVVEERDLVIGTHGRGFYVLDNIGVLRQATPELTTNNLFVFETFNPQRGRDRNVTFDYYLGKDADEVKIEFLDAQGSVLRSFTGTPKPTGTGLPEGVDPEMAAFFGMAPARVGVAKGMNRFTWDMRYEGATVFPGHDHVGRAAAARAGRASREVRRAHHREWRDARRGTSRWAWIRGWSRTASPRPICSSSSSCRSRCAIR